TYLKPEAATSLFPRLIDRNHHFGRLLSQPGLMPPRISTSRVSRATETFLLAATQPMHHLAGGENARCACFDRIRTRAFFRNLLGGKRRTGGRAKGRPPRFALDLAVSPSMPR